MSEREARGRREALFSALQAGDDVALEILLPPLRARLTQVAKRRLPEALTEEVVQEALVTLWLKRDELRDADNLMPFVFGVLRNVIGNAYQRASRERMRAAVGAVEVEFMPDASSLANPAALVAEAELATLIERALPICAERSPVGGHLLELVWSGLTLPEIRERLGNVAESTFLSRVHRARRLLRDVLRDEFGYVAAAHATRED